MASALIAGYVPFVAIDKSIERYMALAAVATASPKNCSARGRHIDVRPNWKEQPLQISLTGKVWR